MSLGHFPGARNGGYGCDVNWSNMRATTALWRGRRPETVSQYRFWPGGLRSVVAGCVPEITLIEKDVHRANKAHSGFNACEGPHLQGGSIHQSLIKTSEIGVARKSPERRPPRRIEFELGCSLVMLLNLIPGDNIPNCLQIVGPPILVEEIVRVLPDIDPENCLKTITYWVILVRGGNDFE